MKAKSLISILLGSLILVSIVHNIMPHHHHLDELPSLDGCHQYDGDDQKDSADHAGDAEDPFNHCHAFNGLEYVLSFEQYSCPQQAQEITGFFSTLVPQFDEPLSAEFSKYRVRGPAPDCPGFLGETSGLRAPPLTA